MRKSGNGEGSITRRKDGRWHGRITVGWNNGKQIRQNIYGKSRHEVHDKLSEAQQSLKAGTYKAGKMPTLGKFLTYWLDHVKVGPTTRPAYRQKLTLHVIPTLGHLRLDRLTVQHVNDLLDEKAKTLSPQSVHHVRAVLRGALNDAVRWERLAETWPSWLIPRAWISLSRCSFLSSRREHSCTPQTVTDSRLSIE